jgi:hypothetical protein
MQQNADTSLKHVKSSVKKFLSEVGFEPTPSDEDQNALSLSVSKVYLESGALDHSAILTLLTLIPNLTFK